MSVGRIFGPSVLQQDPGRNLHEEVVLSDLDIPEEDSIGQVEIGASASSSILGNTGPKTTHTYCEVGTQTSADITIETSQSGVLQDKSIQVPNEWMLESLVVDVQKSGARTVKFGDGLRVVGFRDQSCGLRQDLNECTASGALPSLLGENVSPGGSGEVLLVDLDAYEFGDLDQA